MLGYNASLEIDCFETPYPASMAFSGSQCLVERRRYPRLPFRSYQWIAVRHGEQIPNPADFEQYQCHDISLGGISFLSPCRPAGNSLVVALVALPRIVYMGATVAHCTQVLAYPTGRVEPMSLTSWRPILERTGDCRGTPMVLVGCCFTRRLEFLPEPAR